MTVLPLLGALLAVADVTTHWPPLRWTGYALSIVGQLLAALVWWKARRAPVAVMYGCPNRCGFLGDQVACDAHSERCQVQRWAA